MQAVPTFVVPVIFFINKVIIVNHFGRVYETVTRQTAE
jgi:hypothetical protein